MSKVLIMTHGQLADSLLDTLGLFISDYENVAAICLNGNPAEMREKLHEELAHGTQKDILILADLFGGTPFNIAASLMSEAKENGKRLELVSGVNLPMLLEVVPNIALMSIDELKQTAGEIGKFGIRDLMAELNKKGTSKN